MTVMFRTPLLLLVLSTTCAGAQEMNYTSFEQMFGEPVTESVTGKPQRVSDAPADMAIVTAEDIRRSGADNIPDALMQVPGIDVRRYGERDVSVGIRGYNTALNPRVLVLVDGRQVYQDDYGQTLWSQIPVVMNEIRQIEIIKGPTAALYGFNAVSGVINIVTFDPLVDKVNTAYAEGGTQSQAYGEAVTTIHPFAQAGIKLSARGFRSTEFLGSEGGNTREQPHDGTLALDGRFRFGHKIEWDLSGSISSTNSNYYIDTGTYEPFATHANSLRSRVSDDTRLGILQLDVYRNENRTSYSVFDRSSGWREDVTVVQMSDLIKLGSNHTLRVAGEYRDNSMASLETFDGRLGYKIAAGSLMWDWQILPTLSLTNAIRVDHLSLDHQGMQFVIPGTGDLFHHEVIQEPSFNSGAVLQLSGYDTVRATAARAIQLPSLVDFGIGQSYGPVIVAGNALLQPSAVTSYELDYDRALPALGSTFRLAAFAQQTDTAIGSPFGSGDTILPTGQLLLMSRNFGSSSEIGGEIGIKGSSSSGLRWNVAYSLAALHDATDKGELAMAPSVSYQRQTPVNAVTFGGGYSWRRLELDAQAKWQSHIEDFTANNTQLIAQTVTIPNYITVNARLAYRVRQGITVSLVAEQLLQHRLAETAGLEVDRRVLAGLKIQF